MRPRPRRRRGKGRAQKVGSPEATVRAWLDAWRRRDFSAMVMQCQATWIRVNRQFVRSPSSWLADAFGSKALLTADVTGITTNGAMAMVNVRVSYRDRRGLHRCRLRIKVICEEAPYRPSPAGVWGVNPITALNERPI